MYLTNAIKKSQQQQQQQHNKQVNKPVEINESHKTKE